MSIWEDVLTNEELDLIVENFARAMLWLESEMNDEDSLPVELDSEYDTSDLTAKAKMQIRHDVVMFISDSKARQALIDTDMQLDQFGHDFYLTRNGHGAGFWDRGYGAPGDVLTEKADSFNPIHAWAENGKVHVEIG